MRELAHAEWSKIVGNVWVTGLLVWVFPVGAFGLMLLVTLAGLLAPSVRQSLSETPVNWVEAFTQIWGFANNIFGRMLLLAFTSVVFAGEYQWGTWTNIVPRSQRGKLILVKFFMLGVVVILAFTVAATIWGGGQTSAAFLFGAEVEPDLNGEVVGEFIGDYLVQAGLASAGLLIGAGYVALAAMFLRSILGGVMVGLGITIGETVSLLALLTLGRWLEMPRLVHLFRLTPLYNLDNVLSWLTREAPSQYGSAFAQFGPASTFVDGIGFSVAVLVAWLVVLLTGNVLLFQRQDVTV